jgi:phosphomevalonate kinase
VLSGAYAVLEGATALVAAVDRYVIADASREAPRVTPEVERALLERPGVKAPWFDARALRDEARDRKLGLGSSAAILVASLAALELGREHDIEDAELVGRVLPAALAAHQAAQGGGSGIDVAASAVGGILVFERAAAPGLLPTFAPAMLPAPLFIGVFSSATAASTADMLARVAALREARPDEYRASMARLSAAALSAAGARDGAAFVSACHTQRDALDELGNLANAPIVTAEMRALQAAVGEGPVVLPSGAGGGDIVLVIGTEPLGAEIEGAARSLDIFPLAVSLGARGVHADGSLLRHPERNQPGS